MPVGETEHEALVMGSGGDGDGRGHGTSAERDGGFALLAVLLTLGFLALVVTQIAAAGRTGTRLAMARQQRVRLENAASGGVQLAIFSILQGGGRQWRDDGSPHRSTFDGDISLTVSVRRLDGQVNPSGASAPLLSAMIRQCGLDPAASRQIAASIVAWRTPGAAFTELPVYRAAGRAYGPRGNSFASLADLRQVLGMTPSLVACLAPHLSLTQLADPSPATADPFIRAALRGSEEERRNDRHDGMASGDALNVSEGLRPVERRIDSVATMDGKQFHQVAILDVMGENAGASYVVRRWYVQHDPGSTGARG